MLLYSGGATGADTIFAAHAKNAGHEVRNFSFAGHKTKCRDRFVLDERDLKANDEYLKIISRQLKRSYPTRTESTNNLLRRNVFQIIGTNEENHTLGVYAISTFSGKSDGIDSVSGGTAWAVATAIVEGGYGKHEGLPVSVFDQNLGVWFLWDYNSNMFLTGDPPPFPKIYTGIGTRDINDAGVMAIRDLYR
jgi:hypothetical protein